MGGLEVNCNICKRPIEPNVYTQATKYGMVCNDCGAKLANGQNPDQIINSLNNQEQRIHCCAVCRGQNNKCKYCWGTGAKDGKHPEPFGPFLGDYPWGSKWGFYDLESEQEHLLQEIKQAEKYEKLPPMQGETLDSTNARRYPQNGPCVSKYGNSRLDIRKRYLVSNTQGQLVYVVKTIGNTHNGEPREGRSPYFKFDGNRRERHKENTVGEFKKND